jgi:CheY-like chemotaxis protein/tetratricopeptide (TPR) repeat protein
MSVRGEFNLKMDGVEKVYAIDSARFTLGRGTENSLTAADQTVSRVHAEIIRLGNNFLLRDLGSRNGTFVNGERISEQVLSHQDTVRLGNVGPELTFHLVDVNQAHTDVREPLPGMTESLLQAQSLRLEYLATHDPPEEVHLRCLLAESYLNKGETAKAQELFKKYEDVQQLNLLPNISRAGILLWMGRTLLETKDQAEALNALQLSFQFYQQAGEESGQAEARLSLGRVLIGLRELFVARDHLHRVLLASRRCGNAVLNANAHLMLGKVDWKEGDLEGARYQWMRALRIAEETNDFLLQSRARLRQAFILYNEGKLREAMPIYQSVIDQFASVGNPRLLLKAYQGLSRVLIRLGEWDSCERLNQEWMAQAQKYQAVKSQAVALTELAELRYLQGNYEQAASIIEQSLAKHGSYLYSRSQRIAGRILSARGQHAEAITALEKGQLEAHDKSIVEEQVLSALELAMVWLELKDVESARRQLEAAMAITSLEQALALMGRALYVRGCLHFALNQLPEANRNFTQSLSNFTTIGEQFRMALCHAAIGRLRIRMGRFESARGHLEEARGIFARLGAVSELPHIETQLTSGALRQVQPSITSTLSAKLKQTAALSVARLATISMEMQTVEPQVQRILVAAASDALIELLTRGLEAENYVVERVNNGLEAFERATGSGRYDLLLLDTLLEHRSGFDICRGLRKRNIETPLILLGHRQGIEDKIEALQAGADDFIARRSFVFEELQARMEALLR